MDFEIVSTEECTPNDLSGTSRQEMYVKLEQDLLSQIKMCQANRIYFKSTGDVPSMNKFQQMEEHTKKDLDSLRFAFKRDELTLRKSMIIPKIELIKLPYFSITFSFWYWHIH